MVSLAKKSTVAVDAFDDSNCDRPLAEGSDTFLSEKSVFGFSDDRSN